MPLAIEDGTIVEGANSYVELEDARTFAADRGVTLSADDTVLTPFLIKACDYLETKTFVGRKSTMTQPLSWPRVAVLYEDRTPFPTDAIPQTLKFAQCQLCIEQFNGVVLSPTTDPSQGGFVIREKVDVIETAYSDRVGILSEPIMPSVDAYLKGLLATVGALRSIRV